jgi:DNA-binding response OmpR family regulator
MSLVAERAENYKASAGLKSVLVVENEIASAQRIRDELKAAGLRNHVHCLATVAEMIAYLNGFEQFADREEYPMPAVIILDLTLPGVDGFEAVVWLRSHESFCRTPVIMIGRVDQMGALKATGNVGADAWLVKPFLAKEFETLAGRLQVPIVFE